MSYYNAHSTLEQPLLPAQAPPPRLTRERLIEYLRGLGLSAVNAGAELGETVEFSMLVYVVTNMLYGWGHDNKSLPGPPSMHSPIVPLVFCSQAVRALWVLLDGKAAMDLHCRETDPNRLPHKIAESMKQLGNLLERAEGPAVASFFVTQFFPAAGNIILALSTPGLALTAGRIVAPWLHGGDDSAPHRFNKIVSCLRASISHSVIQRFISFGDGLGVAIGGSAAAVGFIVSVLDYFVNAYRKEEDNVDLSSLVIVATIVGAMVATAGAMVKERRPHEHALVEMMQSTLSNVWYYLNYFTMICYLIMPALQQQEDNEEVFQQHQEMFLSMGVVLLFFAVVNASFSLASPWFGVKKVIRGLACRMGDLFRTLTGGSQQGDQELVLINTTDP